MKISRGLGKQIKSLLLWLSRSWYFIVPVLFIFLILDAILQNHLYFSLFYRSKGWSSLNNTLSVITFFILVFIGISFIISGFRRVSYSRKGRSKVEDAHFTHKITDAITVFGLMFLLISIPLLVVENRSVDSCISTERAWHEIGRHECVTFNAGYVFTSWQHDTFIDQSSNYSQRFSVYVPNGSGLSSETAHSYLNKSIDVTGTITSYRGAPQIMISDPSQVKIAN
jgi:hypothetical protein